jgi:hypothetical protein
VRLVSSASAFEQASLGRKRFAAAKLNCALQGIKEPLGKTLPIPEKQIVRRRQPHIASNRRQAQVAHGAASGSAKIVSIQVFHTILVQLPAATLL